MQVKHPGHPDQRVHGRRGGTRIGDVVAPVPAQADRPKPTRKPPKPKPPKPAPAAASRPPKKFPKGAPDFFEGRKGRDLEPGELEEVEAVFGGGFAGFKTTGINAKLLGNGCTGTGTNRGSCTMSVTGNIADADGKIVGKFSRAIDRKDDGRIVARHDLLSIDPDIQGQGFAQAFNANLEDWYRQSGVNRIELHADIDVGGYAWARAGYDWADAAAARKIGLRTLKASGKSPASAALREAVGKIPPDRLAEQQQLAADMADRMKSGFGGDGYPTPFELAQLGRWPGAGRDDWWIGKAIMMNSDWNGAKPL